MSTAPIFNLKGETEEKANLPKKLFAEMVPDKLMAQAVRVYLNNQRQSPARTKTRGEVSKTTMKMYKQKGTGNARHGSYGAPIFVGGGVALGPTGEENYKKSMPKKMLKMAFIGALTDRANNKDIVVFKASKMPVKTKEVKILEKEVLGKTGKLLVVVGEKEEGWKKAWKNIQRVSVARAADVNTYQVLAHKKLALTEKALEELEKKYAN